MRLIMPAENNNVSVSSKVGYVFSLTVSFNLCSWVFRAAVLLYTGFDFIEHYHFPTIFDLFSFYVINLSSILDYTNYHVVKLIYHRNTLPRSSLIC